MCRVAWKVGQKVERTNKFDGTTSYGLVGKVVPNLLIDRIDPFPIMGGLPCGDMYSKGQAEAEADGWTATSR